MSRINDNTDTDVRDSASVHVLNEDLPSVNAQNSFVTIAKVPGTDFVDLRIEGRVRINALFERLELHVDRCEIQRNGQEVTLDDYAEPGDTIIALVSQIRGNAIEVQLQ